MAILCERITKEHDSQKFMALVQQLIDLLDAKERRLEGRENPK